MRAVELGLAETASHHGMLGQLGQEACLQGLLHLQRPTVPSDDPGVLHDSQTYDQVR